MNPDDFGKNKANTFLKTFYPRFLLARNFDAVPKSMLRNKNRQPILSHHTQIILFWILLMYTIFRLYLFFYDWFGTKRNSVGFKIKRKSVSKIQIWHRLTKIRIRFICVRHFSPCIYCYLLYIYMSKKYILYIYIVTLLFWLRNLVA